MRKIAVRIAGAPRVPPLPVMPWTPDSEAPRRLRNFVEEMLEDTPPARRTRNALGGPGIVVDGRLVSVDPATDPGLEFDAAGVDGKVRVKANAAKAILREAAGVGVGLAANPGLEFDGNNGVRVKVDPGGGLQRVAAGLGIVPGIIVMWSGAIANIPAGWTLCDGGNDSKGVATPDLSSKFIVGYKAADADYGTIGNAGGFKLHGPAENNHGDHPDGSYRYDVSTNPADEFHIVDGVHSEADNRPPYYVLAFIHKD